jgi:hypothetical protein
MLISLQDVGHPKEQAQRAARCALWVRDKGSYLALALVSGWGEAKDGSPVGAIIDRAAELLATAPAPEQRLDEGLILSDATSRQLLEAEFEFVDDERGVVLDHERLTGMARQGLLGRLTPFVGRDREVANIRALVVEAIEDREPAAVVITGEPGLGKSRLREQLGMALQSHESRPQMIDGHGDLMTAGSAFAMIGTLFAGAIGFDKGASAATRRETIEQAVATFVPAAERKRVAEFLGEILRVHFPQHEREQLRVARQNAQIMANQVTRAFVDFMIGFVSARPRVLMLDTPSLKLIDEALQALTAKALPCVVVAFARPELEERFPRLWAKLRLHRITLAPLSRRAATDYAMAVLGRDVAGRRRFDGRARRRQPAVSRRVDPIPRHAAGRIAARHGARNVEHARGRAAGRGSTVLARRECVRRHVLARRRARADRPNDGRG